MSTNHRSIVELFRKSFSRLFLMFLLCGVAAYAAGQDQKARYDSVGTALQAAFNSKEPMKIYELTSAGYRKRMDAVEFIAGTKKFYITTGRWLDLKFRQDTGEGMTYRATFERDTQELFMQLDELGKITRFNFKAVPFVKGTKGSPVRSNNPLASETDHLVEKWVRPYIQQRHTSGLSVAIINRDGVHYYSYGEVLKGSARLPDPKKTLFEIGSVTKTFTSLLLAEEVVRKHMNLQDPISKYLPGYIPDLKYNENAITLEHLANHTSGFPRLPANIFYGNVNPADPYKHYNADSAFRFLSSFKPAVTPGTTFSYSNFGAGLLGNILSRKYQQTFEQRLTERIFRPLHMKDTKIELRARDSTRLAQGYTEKGAPAGLWNLAALQGSGAIRSTTTDMVRYLQAQLGLIKSPLDQAILLTHRLTFQGQDQAIGLGWRIEKHNNQSYWHHSGGTGGFRSFVGFDKSRQVGVVILSNTAEDVTSIGRAIMEE